MGYKSVVQYISQCLYFSFFFVEAQPTVGAEKKEESDSPWDSEVLSVKCASPRSVGEPDENYVRACLCVEPCPW